MQRLNWTAVGAAGLLAGASVAGFTLVTATAGERAVRGIELPDVVDPATGEPRATLADGSLESATGLPTPCVTISPGPSASPNASVASPEASPEVVTRPVVRETAKPAATAKPPAKPKATARPAATASADSSASAASVASEASADSSAESGDSSD